ncbi:MAG: beta-ketoacyl-ACP synthase III, partial [Pseudomonadales bacterium]|nr:beta-ketoacyl-ACP synthase III [Pseudomonadales bacterium]
VGTQLKTQFSSNIRNNYGFMNRADPSGVGVRDKLFKQEGRKVFKEVVPMVSRMVTEHIGSLGIANTELKRLWLHQANLGMNLLITKRILGREAVGNEAPVILDEFANTSSAGSIVAFHRYNDDFEAGDIGVICSFGAGYSVGSVVVRKR